VDAVVNNAAEVKVVLGYQGQCYVGLRPFLVFAELPPVISTSTALELGFRHNMNLIHFLQVNVQFFLISVDSHQTAL
jgi:hypothetical protein